MCFSAVASFAAGTVLVPAGIYCLTRAWRKSRQHLPLAAVPLCFGLQQFSEGVLWHGLEHGHSELVQPAAFVFLFFALAFWPFWFPFISAVSDSRPAARKWFGYLTILSSIWFFVLYLPVVMYPQTYLTVEIMHHSIRYDIGNLPVNQMFPRTLLRALYFACVAVPMVLGSGSISKWPGILFAITAVVAAAFYDYAFVSVWCFFAAWISAYLCYYFYHIKAVEKHEERVAAESVSWETTRSIDRSVPS